MPGPFAPAMESLQITRLALVGWIGSWPSGISARRSAADRRPSRWQHFLNSVRRATALDRQPEPARAGTRTPVPPDSGPDSRARSSALAQANGTSRPVPVQTLTLTDNVALAPSGQEEADLVLGLSLPLGVRRAGPRVKFLADYIPTVYLYARNRDSDDLQNNLRSFLSVEAVDDFFFIDAIANSYPTYISPFLPRPESGASITENRTQQTTLGLSPYIRHETSKGWTYLVRNDNFWNAYSESALANSCCQPHFRRRRVPSYPAELWARLHLPLHSRCRSQPTAYYQQVARVRPILAGNAHAQRQRAAGLREQRLRDYPILGRGLRSRYRLDAQSPDQAGRFPRAPILRSHRTASTSTTARGGRSGGCAARATPTRP